MTALATLLVLGSALMHATWNLFAKRSDHPLAFLWLVNTASLIIYTPVFIFAIIEFGMPSSVWPFAIATSILHVIYVSSLSQAYRYGALSIAYPMSRGTGVALVPLLAVPLLGEEVSVAGIVGIASVLLGIIGLHGRELARLVGLTKTKPIDLRGPLFAFTTGLAISGYSLVDKSAMGETHPLVYGYLIFVGLTVGMTPYVLLNHRDVAAREFRLSPGIVLLGGVLVQGTYLIILAAMRIAPVSYIVPLREVSVIIGAMFGVLLLKEGFGRERIAASLIVAAGVVLIAGFG